MRFETEIFLTKRSPQTLSNLCLSARTESALHITCILTVYTACNVSDSTSDETYTNVLLYWLTCMQTLLLYAIVYILPSRGQRPPVVKFASMGAAHTTAPNLGQMLCVLTTGIPKCRQISVNHPFSTGTSGAHKNQVLTHKNQVLRHASSPCDSVRVSP